MSNIALYWNTYNLISLYELLTAMHKLKADYLPKTVRALDEVRELCQAYERAEEKNAHDLLDGIRKHITDHYIPTLKIMMEGVNYIGLDGTSLLIKQTLKHLEHNNFVISTHDVEGIYDRACELRNRFIDELTVRAAIILPPGKVRYYSTSDAPLFGEAVEDAFPSASFDIAEAGKCFALGRYTASVFHLMRCLEIGLSVLAKRFNVTADFTNWHNIIESILSKVNDMSKDPNKTQGWKVEQEYYAQLCSHFMLYKLAWRNYTAHPRGKFIEEEAENIMKSVKTFMTQLSERLSE